MKIDQLHDILYTEALCIGLLRKINSGVRKLCFEDQKRAYKRKHSRDVLSVVKNEDMCGYKIRRELEVRSENVFSFKEGTNGTQL